MLLQENKSSVAGGDEAVFVSKVFYFASPTAISPTTLFFFLQEDVPIPKPLPDPPFHTLLKVLINETNQHPLTNQIREFRHINITHLPRLLLQVSYLVGNDGQPVASVCSDKLISLKCTINPYR